MSNKVHGSRLGLSCHRFIRAGVSIVLVSGLGRSVSASEPPPIPMTAAQWDSQGDTSFEKDAARQNILVVKKGYAELKNVNFGSGTIEFDTKFVGSQITGITFRHHGDAADALYFRPSPECAVSDDCMQYMPTAHHLFEWDLYGQYQARAPLLTGDWNHIKLVVSGGRMNVFVNGLSSPTLAVGALVGGFPDGSIRLHGPASYANLTIAPGRTEGLSAEPDVDPANGDRRYITDWLASAPFIMPDRMDTRLQQRTGIDPSYRLAPADSARWERVPTDRGGLVNVTRQFGAAQVGTSITGIWLKTTITSGYAQVKHVDVGWTREIWVFVNGKRVFAKKNLYGVDGPGKEADGRLSLTNGSFNLPLRKGVNRVVVALDDNFAGGAQHFGWGMQMRLANADGIGQTEALDRLEAAPGAH